MAAKRCRSPSPKPRSQRCKWIERRRGHTIRPSNANAAADSFAFANNPPRQRLSRSWTRKSSEAYVASEFLRIQLPRLALQMFPQLGQFFIKAAVEDGKAAPGFWIEVLIIQMERWGIPLT